MGDRSVVFKYKGNGVYRRTSAIACDFSGGCFGAGGGPQNGSPRSPDLRVPRFWYVGWEPHADMSYQERKLEMRGAFPCRILDVATGVLDIYNKVRKSWRLDARTAGGFFELLMEIRQWNILYDYLVAYFSVPNDHITNDKSISPENRPCVPRTYMMGNYIRNNLRLRDDVWIRLCRVTWNAVLDVMNRKVVAAPGCDGKCWV
jgi:hypothetical protein